MQRDNGRPIINEHPNIGAFVVDDSTRKYIADVFNVLSLTWGYMPEEDQIIAYRDEYKKHYNEQCLWLFDSAVAINKKIFSK